MKDWNEEPTRHGDVVFFNYVSENPEKSINEVFVWDLDKTYLDTKWASLGDLIKTAMEKAFNKRNVPGTAALVLALKDNWRGRTPFPIYFITATPPQIEHKILEKLRYDGIYPFGMFFKDNLKNVRPGRLRRLTQQVGFKIQALLQLRTRLPTEIKQVMWGDDSESDAIIYSLYSDICARRVEENELCALLKAFHVGGAQTDSILELQAEIPVSDPVEKIYINLASDTDADYYLKFGRRIVATSNTFQAALDLRQDNRIPAHSVVHVAQDMVMNYGFTREELESSLDDLIRRAVLGAPCVEEVIPLLQKAALLAPDYRPTVEPRAIKEAVNGRVYELEGAHEPWLPEFVDYLHDYR